MLEGGYLVVRLSHRARVKNDGFAFFVTISLEAELYLHLVLLISVNVNPSLFSSPRNFITFFPVDPDVTVVSYPDFD